MTAATRSDLANATFAVLGEVKDYGIYIIDPEGRILTWNAGAEAIKGYGADEVIGQSFTRFFTAEDIEAQRPMRLLARAAAEGRVEDETWRVRKDGSKFWANIVITAIHEPGGRLRGFVKVTRDLTERRHMEDQARAAAEQAAVERVLAQDARAEVRGRDEFISVAAHELRTPLTALAIKLQGAVQALRRPDGDDGTSREKVAVRIDGALRQIDRLTGLVERLLDVSRIVRGELAIEVEPTDLTAIVRRVVEDFRETAFAAGSVACVRAPLPVTGAWDPERIEQLVVNLMSNAIKYGEGRPIEIEVSGTNNAAILVVRDHGIGIATDDLARIFTRFQRVAPRRHYGGLGLGLYISRSIVEAHGGTIRALSELGRGATFVVDLPRAPAIVQAPISARREHAS